VKQQSKKPSQNPSVCGSSRTARRFFIYDNSKITDKLINILLIVMKTSIQINLTKRPNNAMRRLPFSKSSSPARSFRKLSALEFLYHLYGVIEYISWLYMNPIQASHTGPFSWELK
jgi:hypothetical protein